tara:strand:+ start:342 stop:542 length:201 start_codon:yes stop_codon:yes gene_type:complete
MNQDDLDPYSPMDLQQILSSEIEKYAVGIVKVQNELDKVRLENKKLRYLLSLPIVPAIVRKGLEDA